MSSVPTGSIVFVIFASKWTPFALFFPLAHSLALSHFQTVYRETVSLTFPHKWTDLGLSHSNSAGAKASLTFPGSRSLSTESRQTVAFVLTQHTSSNCIVDECAQVKTRWSIAPSTQTHLLSGCDRTEHFSVAWLCWCGQWCSLETEERSSSTLQKRSWGSQKKNNEWRSPVFEVSSRSTEHTFAHPRDRRCVWFGPPACYKCCVCQSVYH